MAITTQGIGSGLDIASLVSQLVTAQGAPAVNRLARQEAGYQAEISAFGTLKSALSSVQSSLATLKESSSFAKRSATASDTDIFTATASSTAAIGQYDIDVVQLAQAHKLISDGFASATTTVGTGTLKITQGSSSFSVTIDSSNNTLAGIRDAINNATTNIGVRAAIINVDDGLGGTESKLVLTADDTGLDNAISVAVDENGNSVFTDAGDEDTTGLSQLAFKTGVTNLTQAVAALDGQIKVDDQLVSSSNNSFSGVIDGVTITAVAEGLGETLAISSDTAIIANSLQSFVTNYNKLVDSMKSLTAFNPETRVAATLVGDSTLRAIDIALRRQLSVTVSGLSSAANSLSAIGITADKNGKLSIDQSDLDNALENNFAEVAELFSADDDGIATRLDTLITGYIGSEGIITARTDGLTDRIEDITDQRTALNARLVQVEERLMKQFIAMDELIASLNSTSSFLTQQMANLSSILNRKQG